MHMSHLNLSDRAVAAHVRTQLAGRDLGARMIDSAERRVSRLRDDGEQGSQTAEYAMVGGVGAAAAGALLYCVQRPEVWQGLVGAIINSLTDTFRSWF
jgi:hypothetical protein